jgi:hypothetical protein
MSNLDLTTENASAVAGQRSKVVRRIVAEYLADGKIRFEGSLCDRLVLGDEVLDINWVTPNAATYPSQEVMIALAAENWAPEQATLDAMADLVRSGPLGAATVILQGFAAISKAAILAQMAPEDAPPSPPE